MAQTASVPPALPTQEEPVGERLVGGQYVIHREEFLRTPYLPDVATAGIAIRAAPGHDLPGVTGEAVLGAHCTVTTIPSGADKQFVILVFFSTPWPDHDGFRLILAERPQSVTDLPCAESFADDGAPEWDEEKRTLTLFLSKGRIARLRYSSFIDPDHLGSFGVLRWANEGPENQGAVWVSSALGCHWMLTPYR